MILFRDDSGYKKGYRDRRELWETRRRLSSLSGVGWTM